MKNNMFDSQVLQTVKNLVVLCVDKYDNNIAEGRIYTAYNTQPQIFRDSFEMARSMDAFFDEVGYPQRDTQPRSFGENATTQKRGNAMSAKVTDPTIEKGEMATFVVRVMYRQNATWQGSVLWAEEEKTCNFRSALELIRMMDDALGASLQQEEADA